MSLQLIYTSAERLLEPGMSGYGVVARSEKMSLPLAKKITKLSNFKDFQRIAGPQYSYRIIDCAGQTYHVLSCIQEAGSDYTGRNCHIAHHLALPADLVRNLRQHQTRPTPAGIILSLAESGFWLKSWKGEPTRQLAEAYLSAEALPETHMQKTWLAWTAHKSNARAFSTPPYEHDCLVTVPENISSQDILRLINESDWLDHYRGWGKTFTTHGEAKDTFADTQRIFIVDGDTLEERAKRTGRPILRIHSEFHLPIPAAAAAVDETAQGGEMTEELSETLFAKPTESAEISGDCPIPAPPAAKPIEAPAQEEEVISHKGRKAQRRRQQRMWLLPAAILVGLAGIATLMIQHLQTPPLEGSPAKPHHASAPRPSLPAPPSPAPLASNEAPTNDFMERHATLSGDMLPTVLRELLRKTPALIEQGSVRIGCLDGNSLSMPLRKGGQNLLIEELSDGKYSITLIRDGEKKQGLELILRANKRFHSFSMNGQEAYLLLEIQDEQEEHLILLVPRYQKSVQLPQLKPDQKLNIHINPADITFVASPQNPLAIKMTLTDDYLKNCPKLGNGPKMSQEDGITLTLPQIKRFGSNQCVQSDHDDDTNGLYQWQCQEGSTQNPSVNFYRYRIETRESLSHLILAHFNKLCNRPCANRSHLADPFYSIATLYHILEEFDRCSTPTTSQALTARYCKLYEQAAFAKLLQQIIPAEIGITLTPSESSLQSEECIQKRQEISKQLQNPAIRQSIKESICHFISQEMQQSVTESLNTRQGQEYQVELHKAHSVNGQAVWSFQLK